MGACELTQSLSSSLRLEVRGSWGRHLLAGISPDVLSFAGSAEKLVTKKNERPELFKGWPAGLVMLICCLEKEVRPWFGDSDCR
jgi:hypothetical protein